jgi:uncharacterized membrane protein YedE/YeeE
MPQIMTGLICGFVFGWGLLISRMVQPAKVLAFLDILGAWDPSLAFTMAAALIVSSAGFLVAKRRERPYFGGQNLWPTRTVIDRELITGAALFGVGWGLVGLCPGPALENLWTLSPRIIVFVIAMAVGMVIESWWRRGRLQQLPTNLKLTPAKT